MYIIHLLLTVCGVCMICADLPIAVAEIRLPGSQSDSLKLHLQLKNWIWNQPSWRTCEFVQSRYTGLLRIRVQFIWIWNRLSRKENNIWIQSLRKKTGSGSKMESLCSLATRNTRIAQDCRCVLDLDPVFRLNLYPDPQFCRIRYLSTSTTSDFTRSTASASTPSLTTGINHRSGSSPSRRVHGIRFKVL